jgi:hypothetical protein
LPKKEPRREKIKSKNKRPKKTNKKKKVV